MMKLSILIPCYNESKIIFDTYVKLTEELKKLGNQCEIIFADDGSSDETKKIISEIQNNDRNVKMISYTPNRGVGYACRKMYDIAQGDLLIQMDADLAMDPRDTIPQFIREAESFDIVIGSRFAGIKADYPLYRLIPSRIFYLFCRLLFHISVKDVLSGFIAFKREVPKTSKLNSETLEMRIEFLIKARQMGWKIKEIPIKFAHRREGQLNIFRHGPKLMIETLRLKAELWNLNSISKVKNREED